MKPLLLCMHDASATCFHFVMFLSSMLLPRLLSPTLRICVISCSPLDMADTRGMARVHECADCGAKFSDGDVLDDHIVQVHLDGKPYDGDDDYVPSSDSMDDDDEEDSDDEDDETYEIGDGPVTANSRARHHCRYCSKAFQRSFCLKRHERRHTGEKPFNCQTCGKKFSDRSNLLQHERSRHAETRSYVCTACLKQFAQYNYLRRHLRSVHRNKLSFICPEPCNHAFVTEMTWLQHLRTHRNNVKPITVNGPWPCKGSKTKIPGQPSFPTATRKETAGGYEQQTNGSEAPDVTDLVRPVAMKAFGNQPASHLLCPPSSSISSEQAGWTASDQGPFSTVPEDHFHKISVNGPASDPADIIKSEPETVPTSKDQMSSTSLS